MSALDTVNAHAPMLELNEVRLNRLAVHRQYTSFRAEEGSTAIWSSLLGDCYHFEGYNAWL